MESNLHEKNLLFYCNCNCREKKIEQELSEKLCFVEKSSKQQQT